MNNDQLWDELTNLSTIVGMNQRYAQHMMTEAQEWSRAIDVMVVFSTLFCLSLGIVAYFRPEIRLYFRWLTISRFAVFVSFVAAIAGVTLVVSPASRDANFYYGMLQSWTDLRQDVDSAIVDVDGAKDSNDAADLIYLRRRYRDLLAKKNSLNAREPAADQALLEKFLEAEEKSRGIEGEDAAPTLEASPMPAETSNAMLSIK